AQTDIAKNLWSRTSLCQASDHASCFLIFVSTNSWGIAVRALIGKFDSIPKHHHVISAENLRRLLDIASRAIHDARISVVNGQPFRRVRMERGWRRYQAESSEDRHQ